MSQAALLLPRRCCMESCNCRRRFAAVSPSGCGTESEVCRSVHTNTAVSTKVVSQKRKSVRRQCRLVLWVERVERWLIEVHGVYQQEKRRHRYICLCCFPLCRWNTQSLSQGPGTSITHNTFWHCRVRFVGQPFSKQLYIREEQLVRKKWYFLGAENELIAVSITWSPLFWSPHPPRNKKYKKLIIQRGTRMVL